MSKLWEGSPTRFAHFLFSLPTIFRNEVRQINLQRNAREYRAVSFTQICAELISDFALPPSDIWRFIGADIFISAMILVSNEQHTRIAFVVWGKSCSSAGTPMHKGHDIPPSQPSPSPSLFYGENSDRRLMCCYHLYLGEVVAMKKTQLCKSLSNAGVPSYTCPHNIDLLAMRMYSYCREVPALWKNDLHWRDNHIARSLRITFAPALMEEVLALKKPPPNSTVLRMKEFQLYCYYRHKDVRQLDSKNIRSVVTDSSQILERIEV